MAELEGVFEACVAQLNSGSSLQRCLAMYPAEAAELAPLLQVVAGLRSLNTPVPAMQQDAAQAGRAMFLARASALSQPAAVSAEDALEQATAMLAGGASLDSCLDAFPHHAGELRPTLEIVSGLQQLGRPAPAPQPPARAAARAMFLARATALSQPPALSIEDALDASVQMMASGAPLEECLQAFPHYAQELRPALAITGAMQSAMAQPAPARPAQDVAGQRKAFVAAAGATRRSARPAGAGASWLQSLAELFRQPAWARAAALLLVVLLTFGFGRAAVTMASVALPGDAFYPVKLAAEQARLLVTPDDGRRAALREQFEQNRREEAVLVAGQGRQVEVQFSGVIESMVDGQWQIAGLGQPLLVPGDAIVRGRPAVGANAIILAYSDGSGNLVARQVVVLATEDLPPPTPTWTATRAPTATATAAPPAAVPLATATPTRTPPPAARLTSTPTSSPTGTPTPTSTATATPSPSATPTLTASPTATATPGPVSQHFFGLIQEIHPDWWLVEGRRVQLTMNTLIDESLGPAVVGAEVLVSGMEQPDQSVIADVIVVQRSVVETDFFTDYILQMGSSQWLIGPRWVNVTGSTVIVGTPAVGRSARVSLQRYPGRPWYATRIEVEEPPPLEPVYFEGIISAIGANSWVVDGQTVIIDAGTVITGLPPRVGLIGEVEAVQQDDGLHALSINVVAPTPTPSPTPSPTLTPTPSPTWTVTPTATPETPTATPTPGGETPTPTPTGETPTVTPSPTVDPATATPTATAEPATPTPTETAVQPTETVTPEPASATPRAPASIEAARIEAMQ